MITAADLLRRLLTLECVPGIQETKIFFIDESSDKALTKSQWETSKTWNKTSPEDRLIL